MSVYDNMAFGLKIRHLPKTEIDQRVHEAARILEIEQFLDRKPKALSGGQRQRVALGRAIVRHAKVFLMDEPLSNLDAKLRVQMRAEIIRLHERLNATTIYVTHDQTEAMTMATRIVVMKGGYIQQIGAPIDIYHNPANLFVASFIGSPAMNLIDGVYNKGIIKLDEKTKVTLPEKFIKPLKDYEGKEVVFGIRPEDVRADDADLLAINPDAGFNVEIKVAELLGHEYVLHSDLAGGNIISKVQAIKPHYIGDKVRIYFDLEKAHVFDKESTKVII
jgi:multiple sugar transport system ATP-binding protein